MCWHLVNGKCQGCPFSMSWNSHSTKPTYSLAASPSVWVLPPAPLGAQSGTRNQIRSEVGQCASANFVPSQPCLKPFRPRKEGIIFFKTLLDDTVDFFGFVSFYKLKHCYYRGKFVTRNKFDEWNNSTFCSFHLEWLTKILI